MFCKDKCAKYRPERMPPANRRYSEGFSRCTVCEAWIMWDGMHCPCCHFRLRKVSRNGKYKPAVARI